MTTQETLNPAEISQRGEAIYRRLRDRIETEANMGRQMVIDVLSGDYEINDSISDTGLQISRRLRERHPDAVLYGMRIGYDAVYALSGTLTRTKQ